MILLGRELSADVLVSDATTIESHELVLEALREGVVALGATLLSEHHHSFEPAGVTAVAIIGESHLLASTYPELGLVSVNIQTCSAEMVIVEGLEAVCRTLDVRMARAVMVKRHVDVPLQIESFHRDVPMIDGRLRFDLAAKREA